MNNYIPDKTERYPNGYINDEPTEAGGRIDTVIMEIYKSVLNNCKFYEREGLPLKLLNEIGVLRGVVYCMESAQMIITLNDSDFLHFIEIQEELKKAEAGK